MSETYTYKTMVRKSSAPKYTFAEVKYGKIVSIQEHWVPLEEYRNFFEADAYFIDISGVTIEDEKPAIGDVVVFGEHGYEIQHFKSQFSFAEEKAYITEKLKLIRNEKELEPILYNEHYYDADKDSLMRLDKARQSLEDNSIASIAWTTANNERVDTTVDDFKGINTAIATRSNSLHVRYNQLKEYVDALEEKYFPVLIHINWDWDMECDLDEKLKEYTTEESKTSEKDTELKESVEEKTDNKKSENTNEEVQAEEDSEDIKKSSEKTDKQKDETSVAAEEK